MSMGKLALAPDISVPTITIEGDANGAPYPDVTAYAQKFTGKYEHRVFAGGIGHKPSQEAPQAFADAIIAVADNIAPARDGFTSPSTRTAIGIQLLWTFRSCQHCRLRSTPLQPES
jgi:hypothetical protein